MEIVLGIDIGGTFTKYGLVDPSGILLAENEINTTEYASVDSFIEALFGHVQNSLATVDKEVQIKGVGVGAPNGNYYTGTIEHAPNLPWKGIIPLAELMNGTFGVPVTITNDANAAALGEWLFGAARGLTNFIMITLGTGLGSGFVVNGELVYGENGFAGELGHVRAVDHGRQCGCGKRGCLETYVSATGIKRTVFELMANENLDSGFRKIPFSKLKPKLITAKAEEGDPIAIKAFEKTGFLLGRSLADTVAHVGPAKIFLFGGLAKAGKWIIEPTTRSMEEHLLPVYRNKIEILPSGLLKKNIAVLGAGALVWKKFENLSG